MQGVGTPVKSLPGEVIDPSSPVDVSSILKTKQTPFTVQQNPRLKPNYDPSSPVKVSTVLKKASMTPMQKNNALKTVKKLIMEMPAPLSQSPNEIKLVPNVLFQETEEMIQELNEVIAEADTECSKFLSYKSVYHETGEMTHTWRYIIKPFRCILHDELSVEMTYDDVKDIKFENSKGKIESEEEEEKQKFITDQLLCFFDNTFKKNYKNITKLLISTLEKFVRILQKHSKIIEAGKKNIPPQLKKETENFLQFKHDHSPTSTVSSLDDDDRFTVEGLDNVIKNGSKGDVLVTKKQEYQEMFQQNVESGYEFDFKSFKETVESTYETVKKQIHYYKNRELFFHDKHKRKGEEDVPYYKRYFTGTMVFFTTKFLNILKLSKILCGYDDKEEDVYESFSQSPYRSEWLSPQRETVVAGERPLPAAFDATSTAVANQEPKEQKPPLPPSPAGIRKLEIIASNQKPPIPPPPQYVVDKENAARLAALSGNSALNKGGSALTKRINVHAQMKKKTRQLKRKS